LTDAGKSVTNAGALFWQRLNPNRNGVGIGDAVILFYIAAFVRQYLWIIDTNTLAWILTVPIALFIWFLHIRTNPDSDTNTNRQFWLVVALPLFFIYAMRAAFPDTSFDILDYRLMSSERALRGFPFLAGDFFPSRFPFNPSPDMVTGISRHLLGYRLGTIVNYAVVLWVGTILERLLRPYVRNGWLRHLSVLLLLLTEQILFIINNYMVDLLSLPLLLGATCLASGISRSRNQTQSTLRIAVFLGASVGFKLTNLAFAVPIVLLYAYRLMSAQPRPRFLTHSVVLALAFIAPLLPFTLFIYWQTGNPIFPLYNKIFLSPFWPVNDLVGVRWGPVVDDPRWLHMKWWEVLLWPILLPFRIEHTAGDLGPHAGRLSIAFVAGLFGLLLRKTDLHIRYLSFVTVMGAILWSTISGMHRYAILIELTGGVVIIYFVSRLYLSAKVGALGVLKKGLLVFAGIILVVQSLTACFYVYKFEFGSRPSFFENFSAYATDAKYFLRDYSLPDFLPDREKALLGSAEAWVESSALEGGIEVLLKNDVPALCAYMPEYFMTEESKTRFADALRKVGDRKMFSLSFAENLKDGVVSLPDAGFAISNVTYVAIPYFSQHTRIHMVLIEVLPPGKAAAKGPPKFTVASSALPDEAFKADLVWSQPPPKVCRAGLKETVYAKVRNASNLAWPALGRSDGWFRLLVGNHWLDENNRIVVNDDARTFLLYDLGPNEEIEVPLTITAPRVPGNYVLEIDMLQEGVTWFSNKASKTLTASCRVE
jgi:hypothetical protein